MAFEKRAPGQIILGLQVLSGIWTLIFFLYFLSYVIKVIEATIIIFALYIKFHRHQTIHEISLQT